MKATPRQLNEGIRNRWRTLVRAATLAVIFLAVTLPAATTNQPANYGDIIDKRFSGDSQGSKDAALDENQIGAEQLRILDLENGIKAQTRQMAQPPLPPTPALSPLSAEKKAERSSLAFSLIFGVTVLTVVFLVGRKLNVRDEIAARLFENRAKLMEFDTSLAAFFAELRNGLQNTDLKERSAFPADAMGPPAVNAFLQAAPRQLLGIRALLGEIVRANGDQASEKKISALIDQVARLKESSKMPALHPIYLMACGLEGLINQLSRKSSEFNVSAWRTVGTAADVMEALTVKRLNPELAIDPPVRILAVDDEPISRRAVSFALEKVFHRPSLAADGKEGLALATEDTFDVIFLDVDMPGMDGFELCTKIHETAANRTTPVVFVTKHSDFNSRTKSAIIGGHDLIGKPFLTFEITVKALSLVLRNRLENGVRAPNAPAIPKASGADVSSSSTKAIEPAPQPQLDRPAVLLPQTQNGSKPPEIRWKIQTAETTIESGEMSEDSADKAKQCDLPGISSRSVECLPDTFSAWSPVYLETVRDQLQAVMLCTRPEHLQDLITGLYMAVHSFSMESERARLPAVHRLSSALEAMLKKLMEKPKLCAASVWNSALAALELLAELSCRTASGPDFVNQPPQILVVDDDPVARRTISGAIQLVFGKPANADDGETALAMASEKRFDLILLDVLMPGMDGFEACSKIRKTDFNRRTPVIFISNHDDADSRQKAAVSGGNGFVPKPVFSSQITLTALTSILRSRIECTRPDVIVPVQRELALCEA